MTDTPLSDDVVETVADALARLPCRDMQGVPVGFHDLDILRRREAARAALEAARYGETMERTWREGWSVGYRAGVTDGGSDSNWCDETGDWEKSNTRALLSSIGASKP